MNYNPVSWFEIPVTDMKRAIIFYESVFGFKLTHMVLGPLEMALFPAAINGTGSAGSLVLHIDYYKPSTDGVLIHFISPTGDVSNEEEKVKKAGGKVIITKKMISAEQGFLAVILDSEGNRLALRSKS